MNALVTKTARNLCCFCTGCQDIGVFDVFFLAQICQRWRRTWRTWEMSCWVWQESCGPGHGLWAWSLIFPSPQAPGCPVACVRKYLFFQGAFLVWFLKTQYCLPSPPPVAAPCRNPLPSIWHGFLEFRLCYMLSEWSSTWLWQACEPVWTERHWGPGGTDFSR